MHEAVEACKNDGYQQKVVQISRIEAHEDEVEVVLHECTLVGCTSKATQFSNAHECGGHEEAVVDFADVWEVWLERADGP